MKTGSFPSQQESVEFIQHLWSEGFYTRSSQLLQHAFSFYTTWNL